MAAADPRSLTLLAIIRIDRNSAVSDLDRFVALALPSFRTFMASDLAHELVVVVPHRDVRAVLRRLAPIVRMPLRVIDERDVVPHVSDSASGWTKQQVIKLAAAEVVHTPWFVTLDADVVAARPITRDFLLPGGRAIWQQEDASVHMDWWQSSARVLHSDWVAQPGQAAFGVTPAILHTATVRALIRRLELEYPSQHWTATLMQTQGWTEYTLYWTHAMDTGAADRYYVANDDRPHTVDHSIWVKEGLSSRSLYAHLEEAFAADARHAFFVFQSNLDRPLKETVALLRPYFGEPGSATVSESLHWAFQTARCRLRQLLRPAAMIVRRLVSRG